MSSIFVSAKIKFSADIRASNKKNEKFLSVYNFFHTWRDSER
jgi:hypothetical protein